MDYLNFLGSGLSGLSNDENFARQQGAFSEQCNQKSLLYKLSDIHKNNYLSVTPISKPQEKKPIISDKETIENAYHVWSSIKTKLDFWGYLNLHYDMSIYGEKN